MPRLIDADEFKKENTRVLHCDFPYICEETLEELIDKQPTVEAVEVVRCKDCKKWETINCPFARDFVKWDGFKYCARGERKEDGNKPKSI